MKNSTPKILEKIMREHQEKTRVAKVTIKGAFTAHRVMRFGCPASIKAGLLVLVCATLFCCIRAIEPKSACVDIIARVGHNAKPAMTTLHDAAWNNDLQSASLLLKSGTDVNEKDWLGYSALLKVATRGYLEMARVLLDHGAEVNAKIREGYTALDDAIYANHDEIADLLLLRGGKRSLHACASQNDIAGAQQLLINEVDVNEKNNDGWTPLDCALYYRHTEMINLLRSNGVRAHLTLYKGQCHVECWRALKEDVFNESM